MMVLGAKWEGDGGMGRRAGDPPSYIVRKQVGGWLTGRWLADSLRVVTAWQAVHHPLHIPLSVHAAARRQRCPSASRLPLLRPHGRQTDLVVSRLFNRVIVERHIDGVLTSISQLRCGQEQNSHYIASLARY